MHVIYLLEKVILVIFWLELIKLYFIISLECNKLTINHYQAISKIIYFFAFITLRKRLKRANKSYKIMDAKPELCEILVFLEY